ncbi:metal-dependent hydrolase [Candidatus Saccharibacteria bacterium]|nr:metal-dependent hydrolase [Candidatus Saccharibacteria bacterium]
MANYKGHVAGGLGLGVMYIAFLGLLPGRLLEKTGGILENWQMLTGLLVLAMLFGLWPDIDTNSKGQDIFFRAAFGLDVLLIATGHLEAAAYFGLICMFPIIGKHRGWTHSKWAMFVVPAPIVVVPYINRSELFATFLVFYGAAVVGYFSHLLLDGLIIKGLRLKT